MFIGIGANGKSVLINILISMLGKQNVSSVPLQKLINDRFAAAELYGKLGNFCADISEQELRYLGEFKT